MSFVDGFGLEIRPPPINSVIWRRTMVECKQNMPGSNFGISSDMISGSQSQTIHLLEILNCVCELEANSALDGPMA